ncbi:MAG: RDD family protein [Gammaproteobacteria bacterium]
MNAPNAYAPPKAAVADVDSRGGLSLAGRGTRLGAAILDSLIVMAVVYTPMIVTGSMSAAIQAAESSGNLFKFYGVFLSGGGLIGIVLWLGWVVITFRLVAKNGQTIAKKLLNIKVVRSDGSRATVARIFWLRNVVNGLLSFLPLYVLIDMLFIFGERKQCLHDKIADTIVVNA